MNLEYFKSLGINIRTEDNINLIVSGLSNIIEPKKTEIITFISDYKQNFISFLLGGQEAQKAQKACFSAFQEKTDCALSAQKAQKAASKGFEQIANCESSSAGGCSTQNSHLLVNHLTLEKQVDTAFDILDRLLAGGHSCRISEWEKKCKEAGVGKLAIAMIRFVEAKDFVSFDGGIAKLKKVIS